MNQAFRSWVLGQARLLDQDLISNYATMHQRSLSLAQVKQRFLQAPPDIETIFLLAYTLARLMWLEGRPSHTTKNRFAGQLQLSILFDTTLVIDAAIYAKNPATWRFAHHVERLLTVAGHRLTQKQLGRINRQFDNDFDTTVQAALNGALTARATDRIDSASVRCCSDVRSPQLACPQCGFGVNHLDALS